MLETHLDHFVHDVKRARALLELAETRPVGELQEDLLRASWMFGVGAVDAYFSDAYGSLIAKTLQAKEIEPGIDIPDRLSSLRIPVVAIITQKTGGWRWRMAARELIEDENVLSLGKIKGLFNQFFRDGGKLLNVDTIEDWILHGDMKTRMFGISKQKYKALSQSKKNDRKRESLQHFQSHFKTIFQRRHDCIHNCDRPKIALTKITSTAVKKVTDDLEFLVNRCHESFNREFLNYLSDLGFTAITINRVTQ